MKPRLPSAQMTLEDVTIWLVIAARHGGAFVPSAYLKADRRDADLMLEAQEIAQFGPAAIQLHGIDCRGWNYEGYWIEDTEDGEGVWRRR